MSIKLAFPIVGPKFVLGKCKNVTQYFGANKAIYKKNFGLDGHNGIDFVYDIGSSYGQPIVASHEGIIEKVVWEGEHSSRGNGVYIFSNDGTYRTIYWHLSAIYVKPGDKVKMGQLLGAMGNSGWVMPVPTPSKPHNGTHLHFGIRLYKNNKIVNEDNGFEGYIDPMPLFSFPEMRYVIVGKEQYILIDELGMALNIADEEELKYLQDHGLQGQPEPYEDISDYTIYPLVKKNRLKDLFGV